MRDDQRHRIQMGRTDVQEMNIQSVNLGRELRKSIEPRFVQPHL
jgi:hypothetical protein